MKSSGVGMSDAIRWEQTACPVCGSSDESEFLRAPGDRGIEFRLARCRACETVFTNPRPDATSIAQFYPADYAPHQPRDRRKGGRLRDLRKLMFGRPERSLADRIPVPSGGRLLDYGCGSGRFAARMRERGWNACAMDISAQAAATARRVFGLTAIHGALPHPAVPPGSFDAITVREVLEHLHDPRAALRACFDALAPGGWLYVSVPNLAGWGFRAFGPAWAALDLPRHLTHFTAATLGLLLADCGFSVTATRTRGHVTWTAGSVARAKLLRPRWWTTLARVRFVQSALTTWTQWRGAADSLCVLARKPDVSAVRKAA
jgi:2-polyprenyl-3-methyl-5-hydroxy-6-metoxy-1,4-benzoquinol methylase